MPDLPAWFCCLNPTERGVLRSTAEALLLTLFVGVPKDLWDTFWFASLYSGQDRRDAFIEIYALEIVTIIDVETDEELLVVRPTDFAFWSDASLFTIGAGSDCGGGCSYTFFD